MAAPGAACPAVGIPDFGNPDVAWPGVAGPGATGATAGLADAGFGGVEPPAPLADCCPGFTAATLEASIAPDPFDLMSLIY
jgi:hypothetical protein